MGDMITFAATLTGVALGLVSVVLYSAWRRPDKACRWCGGKGVVLGCSPVLGRLVGGRCWFCKGQPWRVRRLSYWLGWDRNSRFR